MEAFGASDGSSNLPRATIILTRIYRFVFATLCFLVVVRAHHASDKIMLLCGLNKVFLPVLCYFERVMPAHLRIMFISIPIVCTCNFFNV
jgi:hypothetical protein